MYFKLNTKFRYLKFLRASTEDNLRKAEAQPQHKQYKNCFSQAVRPKSPYPTTLVRELFVLYNMLCFQCSSLPGL